MSSESRRHQSRDALQNACTASCAPRAAPRASRTVRETERMSAVVAHVFGIAASSRQKSDPMGAEETAQRMADFLFA